MLIGLVAGLVADDDEAGDLVACEGEVVGEDQRVRKSGLVVLAVDSRGDDPAPVVLLNVGEVGGNDVVTDALLVGPPLDGGTTPELALDVVDEAVLGEWGDHGITVEGVGAGEEVANGLGDIGVERGGHCDRPLLDGVSFPFR